MSGWKLPSSPNATGPRPTRYAKRCSSCAAKASSSWNPIAARGAPDRPRFHPRHQRDRNAHRAGANQLVRRHGIGRRHPGTGAHPGRDRGQNFARPPTTCGTDSSTPASIRWDVRDGTTTATPPSCGGSTARVLRAVTRRFSYTLARRAQVTRDHRRLVQLIKEGNADEAATLIYQHVEGAGRHILEQMRAMDAAKAG